MICVTLEGEQFFYVEDIETMSRIVKTRYPEAGTPKGSNLNLIQFNERDACEVSRGITDIFFDLMDTWMDVRFVGGCLWVVFCGWFSFHLHNLQCLK